MKKTRLFPNKSLLYLILLIPMLLLTIGIASSQNLMYIKPGIQTIHLKLKSIFDGIELETNYIKPNTQNDLNPRVGMIIAHGYSNDRWWVQNFAISAAKLGIHVVAMDYRGHGLSGGSRTVGDSNQSSSSWQLASEQAAKDMYSAWEYLDEIGCEDIFIAGHSMGGYCATRFAIIYPDLVEGLITIGATYPYIGEDISINLPKNVLFLMGEQEELFTIDSLFSSIQKATNNPNAQLNTLYGNFSLGTAREAQVISKPEGYLGHIQEPFSPYIHNATFEWIAQIMNSKSQYFSYTPSIGNELINETLKIQKFQSLIYSGVILAFIILIGLVSLNLSLKNSKVLVPNSSLDREGTTEIEDISQKQYGSLLNLSLFYLTTSLFSWLGFWLTVKFQIVWFPISVVPYYVGELLFGSIGGLLFIFAQRWNYFKKQHKHPILKSLITLPSLEILKNRSKKTFWIQILFGIGAGFLLPTLFQFAFISFNIPNFIGDFPSTGRAFFSWMFLALFIAIFSFPEEVWIRSFQQNWYLTDIKGKIVGISTIFILKIMRIIFNIFILSQFNIGVLSIVFILGFQILSDILQFLNIWVYKNIQNLFSNLIISGIVVGWGIISFLPFYKGGL